MRCLRGLFVLLVAGNWCVTDRQRLRRELQSGLTHADSPPCRLPVHRLTASRSTTSQPPSLPVHRLTASRSTASQPPDPPPYILLIHRLTAFRSTVLKPPGPPPHSLPVHSLTASRSTVLQPPGPPPHSHGWRIVKTTGGAFRLVTIHSIAYRLILPVLIMDLP